MDTIFSKAKEYWSRLRETHGNIRSLQFVKFVITTSFVPIFIYLIVWLYAIYAMHIGLNVNILVSLLTELRLFVSVIFSTQTVTGLLAYGVALIDSDGNGESDELDVKAHARQPQQNNVITSNEMGDTK